MTAPTLDLAGIATDWMHEQYLHLHRHPELSMQEHETAAYIEARLAELGIENFRCGGTGVVGILRNGPGKTVAFRADTDGLPIKEDTGADYASTATSHLPDGTEVPVMHGCGHDTHVAVLLAAARFLAENKPAWHGTLVLVFQPGEETGAGARAMVQDGLWERAPRPDVVLGQHVFPYAAGSVHISSGTAMALADALKVTLRGKQSHGSQPQDSIDPILLGAHIIARLQGIVSRELAPTTPAVVTAGTFHAGLKENIIPDRAEFTLNVRTLTPEVRATVLEAITRIINAEAQASNAPAPQIEHIYDFPRCYNDPAQTQSVIASLRAELGEEQVVLAPPVMGSEDVGWLGDSIDVPTVYWFFGGFPAGQEHPPVNHSPYFLPAMEPTLSAGVRAAVAAISGYLA
ncbi:amidohydrolase [Paeniglutamicibacter sp. ABSL32-1]|uniref:amidohydrolase n=1 Tax=Paeniglutamicibacter quisquiliarum TaxID=2849498 RepID=UPI001C2DED41|nr:amidohydrolase [Paeniglutamicibacter quisquiliarum]MBV1777614.1 amidohydrolase [Paeniglutamicibacter quisquiliarum]